jgi:hypothetical protein
MGYSNFRKIQTVTKKFGLSAKREELFPTVPLCEPSSWLAETLKKSRLVPLTNEKTKAERIVSPMLVEIAEFYQQSITLFSGENLEVNPINDLSGECDFFFTVVPRSLYLESPIVSLVESKDEDMEWGTAQCAAQLYGTKLFNEKESKDIPVLYGCATDGVEWQFLRFENNVFYVDNKVYTHVPEVLGVWHTIIKSYL